MWVTLKYILLSSFLVLNIIYTDTNYFKFGILSELLWLFLYSYVSVVSTCVNDIYLLTIPFFVLVLTAVEAVIFWSLLLWNTKEIVC